SVGTQDHRGKPKRPPPVRRTVSDGDRAESLGPCSAIAATPRRRCAGPGPGPRRPRRARCPPSGAPRGRRVDIDEVADLCPLRENLAYSCPRPGTGREPAARSTLAMFISMIHNYVGLLTAIRAFHGIDPIDQAAVRSPARGALSRPMRPV